MPLTKPSRPPLPLGRFRSWHHNRVASQSYRAFTFRHASATLPPVSFGATIRRKREALGFTLEEFAERAHLSPNYIGTVENGRRDPSLSTVLALAKALRVPAGELLGGVKELGPEGLEAGRLFESASPEVQEAVLHLLRVVARRRR